MRKMIGATGLVAAMVTGIVVAVLHARGENLHAPATQPDTRRQKTPNAEIDAAIQWKDNYFAAKRAGTLKEITIQ